MRYDHTQIHAAPVAEGARFEIGSATAFAVRQENKDIALRIRRLEHPVRDWAGQVPFLRGIARLLGCVFGWADGAFESGELEPQRIVKGSPFEQRVAELFRVKPTSLVALGSAILIVLMLGGFLWAIPWVLGRFALSELPLWQNNALCCLVRLVGACVCAALIPRLRVLNRFCMYRGAINQVINAYEALGGAMNRDNAEEASPYTGRSDMAFAMLVLLAAILVFSWLRTYTLAAQLIARGLIILAIAAILGELVHWLQELLPDHPLYPLHAPMRLLERLVVLRPHRQMIEVALYAFNAARENDEPQEE